MKTCKLQYSTSSMHGANTKIHVTIWQLSDTLLWKCIGLLVISFSTQKCITFSAMTFFHYQRAEGVHCFPAFNSQPLSDENNYTDNITSELSFWLNRKVLTSIVLLLRLQTRGKTALFVLPIKTSALVTNTLLCFISIVVNDDLMTHLDVNYITEILISSVTFLRYTGQAHCLVFE